MASLDDEGAVEEMFVLARRTRHDTEKMRFRRVHRYAVIVDDVIQEETADGSVVLHKEFNGSPPARYGPNGPEEFTARTRSLARRLRRAGTGPGWPLQCRGLLVREQRITRADVTKGPAPLPGPSAYPITRSAKADASTRSRCAIRLRCPRSVRRKRYPARSCRTRHGRSRLTAGRPLPGVAAAAPAASGDCRVIQPALHAPLLGEGAASRWRCAHAAGPPSVSGRQGCRWAPQDQCRSPQSSPESAPTASRHQRLSPVSNTQRGTLRSPAAVHHPSI